MRKWTLPTVAVAIVALAFVAYTSAGDKHDHKKSSVAIGQPAPGFSLPDQNGKTVNLADFAGKIVVLEWFNNECPYVVAHYKNGNMNLIRLLIIF